MASTHFVDQSSKLMFLSMGVLALLLVTYFTVSTKTNLNPTVGASRKTSFTGILKFDPKHLMECNQIAKSDYFLQSINGNQDCTPVVTNKSTAEWFIDQNVMANGEFLKGKYYISDFTPIPGATLLPKATLLPLRTPTSAKPNTKIVVPPPIY